jgi:hypothetical protein
MTKLLSKPVSIKPLGSKRAGQVSKKPILIPSLGGFMIDLAAIVPFLHLIFFGLEKEPQVGGHSFEVAVRNALRARGLAGC